jgi:hypothetical protein
MGWDEMYRTLLVHGTHGTLGGLEGSSDHVCAVQIRSVCVAHERVLILDPLARLLSYRCRSLLSRQQLVSDAVHRLSVHKIAEKIYVCCSTLSVI